MKKEKVLLIAIKKIPFVQKDLEMLEGMNYEVRLFILGKTKGWPMMWNQIRLFFWLLFNLRKARSLVIWFVDYHALLPALLGRLTGKKVIEIVGGTDAVSIPSIKFGIFYKNNLRSRIVKTAYRLADYIFPVHDSLIRGVNYYADPSGNGYPIGVLNFVSRVHGEFKVVPTIYNSGFWRHHDDVDPIRGVVTTASVGDWRTFKRKGIDMILEVARLLPDVTFTVLGIKEPFYRELAPRTPENVRLIKYVPQQEMPRELSRHKVYVQLSLSEGLPNALCEGMLCECVPVGSDVNGIPDAIGDTGYVLKKKDARQASKLILAALDSDPSMGQKARERVMKLYPPDVRAKKFKEVLEGANKAERTE